jgi:hypothetical protein
MFLAIDGQTLRNPPHSIDIIEPEFEENETADGNMIMVESQAGVTVNANYDTEVTEETLMELRTLRKGFPIHMISVQDTRSCHYVHLNAYMPKVSQNTMRLTSDNRLANTSFTVAFRQVRVAYEYECFELWLPGTITTGDGKFYYEAPAAGKIAKVDGFIQSLGSGAGQTRIQIHDATSGIDMLGTRGDFVVASGTKRLENQVLISDPSFIKGDILRLDVDAIPAGANSAWACIYLWVYMFRS